MIKFIRSRTSHANAERHRLQKQLYEFNKTLHHGFPHRPTALAYDSELSLLAIATKAGSIRIYGQPGVEFETQLEDELKVTLLQFIDGAGQLFAVCEDNSVHLLQIDNCDARPDPPSPSPAASPSSSPSSASSTASPAPVPQAYGRLTLVASDHSQVNVDDGEEARTADRHQITNILYVPAAGKVLIGDACGQITALQADSFQVDVNAGLRTEQVIQALPEEQRRTGSLGAVEALAARPHHPDQILVGYNRGIIIVWNLTSSQIDKVFVTSQRLESVCWLPCGQQLISAHNDGYYVGWKLTDEPMTPSEPPNTVYGPFPCKPINKVYAHWDSQTDASDKQLLIFSGGLQRQSYCYRHTVSVVLAPPNGSKHKTFDFTSKVIDFVVIEKRPDDQPDHKKVPVALIVLAEEELVAIDLQHADWLQFRLPYLFSVHLSPITCSHAISGISTSLFNELSQLGQEQNENKFSTNTWPVTGGCIKPATGATGATRKDHEIVITGHEDGSVRLWDASTAAMTCLCSLDTSKLFSTFDEDAAMIDEEDEEWPPFRRVGVFDPYTDDPRLGIRKVLLCPHTGRLVVAGTAGQLFVYSIRPYHLPITLNPVTINLVGDCTGFVWRSHDKLSVRTGTIEMSNGYQPVAMVQLWPPAAVTALSLHSDWGLVAVGTGHGFAVFDYKQDKPLCVRCTLNPADVLGVGSRDALITRRKSFKKSLRESFRRLRRSKSQRQTNKKGGGASSTSGSNVTSPASPGSPAGTSGFKRGGLSSAAAAAADEDWHSETKPVERQIEAKGEDGLGSVVRCLHFSSAPVSGHSAKPVPSLWAGTNAGRVFVYTLELGPQSPARNLVSSVKVQNFSDTSGSDGKSDEKSATASPAKEETGDIVSAEPVPTPTSMLVKEIQLKHHAPVIYIHTIDFAGRPSIDLQEATDKNQIPKVLICSEEQFKLFQLPNLKALGKFKLTAHEGSKARRIHLCEFVSSSDASQREFAIVCGCNQGLVSAYSMLELKRQLQAHNTKKEDINGICSLVFTDDANGFYLSSPSEFARFSLAAGKALRAQGTIQFDSSVRITHVDSVAQATAAPQTTPEEQTSKSNGNVETVGESADNATDSKSTDNVSNDQLQTSQPDAEAEEPKQEPEANKTNETQANTTEQALHNEPNEQKVNEVEQEVNDRLTDAAVQPSDQTTLQQALANGGQSDVHSEQEKQQEEEAQVQTDVQPEVQPETQAEVQEEHEQRSALDQATEQLQALSIGADDSAHEAHEEHEECELFEDSRADEDTIIDHVELNGRHSSESIRTVSPAPLQDTQATQTTQTTQTNGINQPGDSNGHSTTSDTPSKSNGIDQSANEESRPDEDGEPEAKRTSQEPKGKGHKSVDIMDDHNRLMETSELKSL